MKTKKCPGCLRELSVVFFTEDLNTKDKYAYFCRKCHNEYQNEWRRKNPDKMRMSYQRISALTYGIKHKGKYAKQRQKLNDFVIEKISGLEKNVLARALHVTRGAIHGWLKNKSIFFSNAIKLAAFLKCEVDDILKEIEYYEYEENAIAK